MGVYSIVVSTFNHARILGATLDSLLRQEGACEYEVVVVDNNSADDTPSIARAYQHRTAGRVRYVFEGEQGLSAARNAGIAAARGEIVAFVDDDVIVSPGWLHALAATYQAHQDAWCVGGQVKLRLPETRPAWFDLQGGDMTTYLSLQDFGEGTFKINYPRALVGANLSVRRDAFLRVGAFRTNLGRSGRGLRSGEDIEFCFRIQRAGGGVYYCSQAVVTHLVPASRMTKGFFRKRAYWQGRTNRLLSLPSRQLSSWRTLGREGTLMMKDWVKTWAHYCRGDRRRAFEHELAAWKRLGYFQQTFLSRRLSGAPVGYPGGPT